jgi:hypothetical protein
VKTDLLGVVVVPVVGVAPMPTREDGFWVAAADGTGFGIIRGVYREKGMTWITVENVNGNLLDLSIERVKIRRG